MEALLAHSFDYLSSYDQAKIRKGLRQVEGLLAQICLSRSKAAGPERRRSLLPSSSTSTTAVSLKPLDELCNDLAFREFFKLQEGFQWNVALRLITCLEHLLGRGSNEANDLLIISALDLIQGVLLLHPPSRALFAREIYMNLLLDLLEPANCPAIQSATLLTLVTALLDHPENTRTFEELDGLLTVTSLFKLRSTSREVKLKLVEFLYFYLMPETPSTPNVPANAVSAPNTGMQQQQQPHRRPTKLAGVFSRSVNGIGDNKVNGTDGRTKTTEEKQELLGRYLNNVADLVEDLKETAPFGGNAVY
ncbi:hypothetical protein VTO42DRAFT_2818 [Malbranchea cinnamomea]